MVDDGQILLAGAVRAEAAGPGTATRYYNSVIAINSAGVTYDAVDKMHLVPFGEYVPFAELLDNFGIGRLAQSVAPFSAGTERHAIDTVDGVSVLPFICYEIIFPGLVDSAGTQADLLLNVTNDAWFGDTPGPYQHFRQAQFRAVEAGLPVVRAANNGISGVIDAYGRIVDGYAVDAVGVLDVGVPRQRLDHAVPFAPAAIGAGLLAALGLLALAARIYSTFRKY
jgi:apolipoprotein N-acyltransferase